MKIVMAIMGLLCGFLLGQLILSRLLKGYDRDEILELMQDKGKRFKYGILNWVLAAIGGWSFVWFYETFAKNWFSGG